MKRETKEEKLLADLFSEEDELRSSSLARGLALSQRKRVRRRTWRVAGVFAPLLVAAALFVQHRSDERSRITFVQNQPKASPTAAISATAVERPSVRVINDTELLDLFKGRPVALVGRPGHQRLLLFDEENK